MEIAGFMAAGLLLLIPGIYGMALPEDNWYERMQVDPGWISDETGYENLPKPGKACGGKPADVYFLLDASDEVGEEGFKASLQYASDLVPTFDEERTRIGVITFSDNLFSVIHLGQYRDSRKIQDAILRIPFEGGQPDIGKALRYVRRKAFSPEISRPEVAHMVIVMTNGRSRNTKQLISEALRVKKTGVYMYAVYPSESADVTDLEAIASDPVDNFLYSMKTYNILTSTQGILKSDLCEIQVHPTGPRKVCDTRRAADIVFALDYATIGVKKSKKVLKFIKKAVDVLDIGSDRMHVGVVTNDRSKQLDIDLEDHYTNDGVLADIDSMKLPSQAELLKKARRRSFSRFYGARVNIQQTLVLFVDDKLDNPTRVIQEAQGVKARKIQIIVIAVGNRLKIKNLHSLATGNDSVLQIDSFDDLLSSKDDVLEFICRGL